MSRLGLRPRRSAPARGGLGHPSRQEPSGATSGSSRCGPTSSVSPPPTASRAQVRVVHGGKVEIDRPFGDVPCLPLGRGAGSWRPSRWACWCDEGKLDFDDRLDRRLPSATRDVLRRALGGQSPHRLRRPRRDHRATRSTTGWTRPGRSRSAPRPARRVDPGDGRPWLLVERVVTQVRASPSRPSSSRGCVAPAGMTGTSLGPTRLRRQRGTGTTTLEDQFRLVDALRTGKLVLQPGHARCALGATAPARAGLGRGLRASSSGPRQSSRRWVWRRAAPRPPTSCGSIRRAPTRWCFSDAPRRKTARGLRTALGEFYALPPGPPQAGGHLDVRGPLTSALGAAPRTRRRATQLAWARAAAPCRRRSARRRAGARQTTTRPLPGLHVGAELLHVGLAGLASGLEVLLRLLDVRLALGRDLIRVLLEAGESPPGPWRADRGGRRRPRRDGVEAVVVGACWASAVDAPSRRERRGRGERRGRRQATHVELLESGCARIPHRKAGRG